MSRITARGWTADRIDIVKTALWANGPVGDVTSCAEQILIGRDVALLFAVFFGPTFLGPLNDAEIGNAIMTLSLPGEERLEFPDFTAELQILLLQLLDLRLRISRKIRDTGQSGD